MRPLHFAALLLVVGTACGTAGYFAGESRSRTLVAETNFAAFQHYVPAILYLRKGDVTSAKNVLYTGADVAFAAFAEENGGSLSASSRSALADMLPRLNAARYEDDPTHGEGQK